MRCGMLNAVDGSEDHLIRVRGIENYSMYGDDEDSEFEPLSDSE